MVALAALLVVEGAAAVVLVQQDLAKQAALQSVADQAAAYIDGVSATAGENAARMSLGPGGSLELPEIAAGNIYTLTLSRSEAVAAFDGHRAAAILHSHLHLWEPRAGPYTTASVAELDALHPSMTLESGGSAIVSRRYLTVDGNQALETFAFP